VQVQGPTGQEPAPTVAPSRRAHGRIEHRGCGCREVVETAGDRRSFTIANMVELVSTGKGETAAAADVEDAKKDAAAVDLADAMTNKATADIVVCDSKGVARQMQAPGRTLERWRLCWMG